MAYDIYRNVLDKLTMNYCNLKTSLKCDYAQRILKELKERSIKVDDDTYQRVARMIFKNNGVKINLNSENNYQKEESSYSNYNNFSNTGFVNKKYDNKNYNSYNNGNKRDSNKDELQWQRKNNNNKY